MDLKFRRTSKAARRALCRVAMEPSKADKILKEVENRISELTGHNIVKIVNSGNAALLAVMSNLPSPFLIPDEGGWRGFKQIPKFLGKKTITLKTRLGIIEPGELEDTIRENRPSALFLTSFAGYTAEQPVKEIYDICSENGVVLVEDASGSIGDPLGRLCNSEYNDVIIASTGSPKIVNAGGGGFIATSNRGIFKDSVILRILKVDPYLPAAINEELKKAPQTLKKLLEATEYLKSRLERVYHPKRRGVNIIIPTEDPVGDARRLRKIIKVDGGNILTVCPNYDRLKKKALAVEIKNLEVESITKDNLDDLIGCIESMIRG
ncbi:DegT/DnrJ/EryC1/StrS family aminotransferase [Methanothermobacter tenebrarum]|uniref:DegT/DnrJ/EryC1/StrS aminotransferase family protein n=1 Tax=Methanothermobacter tenebrarum TaxID=680118 RepID=A0A328PCP1_9EURY|nr:DegT/DnrJ/EryC1/StrS family aminotransferase [Methanothermobacter tenebrarum]MBC7117756.1 DegT/DnrJ/EryC1/StrS family aminotransferase [Methanobacteriaceae archaeon]NPV64656.1 DegT/DnrJ/EryC1/StrS aminotransferase family protein [Methanobacteriaceae archaeon]RAO78993.1 DegT/DnrJ/EryC1/StrS aminotransferase family protein [Methanothermobacter tenebrarum]